MKAKLGIDIGGTFTDLVFIQESPSEIYFAKALTTYPDPTLGIINGIRQMIEEHGLNIGTVDDIVHGTTLVTNAVIERKGAKTGLITTRNFEDVLEIGREMRYDIYDIFIKMPKPLVEAPLRVGVEERMNFQGEVLTPLNEQDLLEKSHYLVSKGVQSVAISFLHAYSNPRHESIAAEIIQKTFPHLYVSTSSDIMPEVREYERTSATVMNAYVQPLTTEYLNKLYKALSELGFSGKLHIMDSAGRLTSVKGASKHPIHLLESGPAGGTMASIFFGKMTGRSDFIAFDMGGTTAKATVVKHFQPTITHHFEAAREKRFKKGSGLPVRIPVIDMIEIGAGGGSIAKVDHLGLLSVGPDSASSTPGPACYNRGGEYPTVTDADLVLGYLNPNYFLGGTMSLDIAKARSAIDKHIASKLKISVEEAAWGIHRIVNENMANAARVHIVEKGLDPRHFSMIAFGGAGPVHAYHTAKLLHTPEVIVPKGAGVLSAFGFLVSPIAKEEIFSYISELTMIDWSLLDQKMEIAISRARAFVTKAGNSEGNTNIQCTCDMRYKGQGHEICVPIPWEILENRNATALSKLFEQTYQQKYGRIITGMRIETITWRILASAPTSFFHTKTNTNNKGITLLKASRNIFWGNGYILTPVYNRYAMTEHDELEGPCIIEEHESTTIVGHGAYVTADSQNNLFIKINY